MNDSAIQTNFREVLEKDGVLVYSTQGISMRPMLVEGRDNVVIKKIDRKPVPNDVVFYKRDNGPYLLHRLIKVTKDGYIIRGDNCYANEYDIKDRHIFGILEGYYKKDKYIDCKKSLGYKIYVQFNRRTYYLRIAKTRIINFLSRVKHKLFK